MSPSKKRPLRFLLVPDKFKGSLTAEAAALAMERGILDALPNAQITRLPITDGGEGFVKLLTNAAGGELHRMATIDPLGRPCRAAWGLLPDGTAVAGLTEASGIGRLKMEERRAGATHNLGTGHLMARLAAAGVRKMHVGLGGSCTTEGGIGLAIPFGFRFLDRHGREIEPTGFGLSKLSHIIPPEDAPFCKITAATDVDNPLHGPNGAACIFARQKGATPAEIRKLDTNLQGLAEICARDLGRNPDMEPGAGSAGGCGYGLATFLGAKRVSGFALFAQTAALDERIQEHDIILTGEGGLDASSLGGKAPAALAAMAKRLGKPVWGFCGAHKSTKKLDALFDSIQAIRDHAPDHNSAIKNASRLLRRLVAVRASNSENLQNPWKVESDVG